MEKKIEINPNGVLNYGWFNGLNLQELELIKQVLDVAILNEKGDFEAAEKLQEKQIQQRVQQRSTY